MAKESRIEKPTELIPGGLAEGMSIEDIANKHSVHADDIRKQIKKGEKIELEHTDDILVAAEIARDHLVEFPFYYDFLEQMEKDMKVKYSEEGYGPGKETPKDPVSKKDNPVKDNLSPEGIADAKKKEAIQRLFG